MTKKINLNELRRLVEQVLNEESDSSKLQIDITKEEGYERAQSNNRPPSYSVDYVFEEDGLMLQFSGRLRQYHTGRSDEYEFEPSWFMDDESEEYYNQNWEKVEDQIMQKFYEEPR